MKKLRVLDLFSGIGGFSLGLEHTGGFETVAFCEMKDHAQRVLAKNFPGVPCHDDVTTYQFEKDEADVITAGFPCQDISFAGGGAGLAGERSGLYREVIRAVRVVRPLYAVLENVAALLGRGLDTVLGDMAEIGYDAEWHCIPASAVGAPHRRDRIWIVAHPGSEQHESRRAPLSGTIAEELSGTHSNTDGEREPQSQGTFSKVGRRSRDMGQKVADAERDRLQGKRFSGEGEQTGCGKRERRAATRGSCEEVATGSWWAIEPDVGRVAHGVPSRVDRLSELGNAVVPQIPEIIGRAILEAEGMAA